MTITVTDPAPEVEQLDVDALRNAVRRHVLDLADEQNLRGLRDINFNDDVYNGRQRVWMHLYLDDDSIDAHAAWTQALGLPGHRDRALSPPLEPTVSRTAEALNLLGLYSVEVTTFLHPARGLPEQGPRPTDAELIVAAVLTPDAPELPAEPAAPRSWVKGEDIPNDVTAVVDREGDTWRREGHVWIYGGGLPQDSDALLRLYGPVTEVVDEVPAEPSEIGRPDIVPGDEWADWDEAEKDAVRRAYADEYGSEVSE